MRSFARLLTLCCGLALAAPVAAQTITLGPTNNALNAPRPSNDTSSTVARSDDATRPAVGASMTGLRAGVHVRETPRPSQPNAAATHANLGQARAMMIVGVAALVAGAIIGDTPGTIIMVGGAVVGLLGLYDYLQ